MFSVSSLKLQGDFLNPPVRSVLMIAAMSLLIIASAAFMLGRATAPIMVRSGLSLELISDLRPALAQQRSRLQESRQQLAANQTAISRRLGRMQAEILRLNAAGQQLTEIAQLSDDPFDFGAEPPLGGPSQPGDELLAPTNDALDLLEAQLGLKERQLDILEHLLLVSQLHSAQYPSGWPIKKGFISSLFGRRSDPFTGRSTNHGGVDFAARMGADVMAVAAGVVSYSGVRRGYGNVVEINHGNGYMTRYGHNSRNVARVGDRVSKGQTIALVGKSGRATGTHVHFEVMVDGQRIDPQQYVSSR
jgi:murein DD-endopeptidase MepM/ murein hydrolase activator NlpD